MWKQRLTALLAALLLLTACAGRAMSDPVPEAEEPSPKEASPAVEAYEEPEYEIVPFTTGNQVQTEDGEILVHYNYQTVRLALHNSDAVSPEDGAAAERNISVFNEKMQSVTEELMKQGEAMGEDASEINGGFGSLTAEYEDDAETFAVFTGDVLSVCLRRYSYTGGAHANSYVLGWLFDLASGQFVLDPSQLADDPALFHESAAELLIEKAGEGDAGEYWDDYQDIIRGGHGGVTLFDEEGMTVLYAPYELGPYVIGTVELKLSWEELAPLLGRSGMERFGMAE